MRETRWHVRFPLSRVLYAELQALAESCGLDMGEYVGEVVSCYVAEKRLAGLEGIELADLPRNAPNLAIRGAVARQNRTGGVVACIGSLRASGLCARREGVICGCS
jgi:hypothetical protein